MRTKIVKWGNSLGLRIPKAYAEDIQVTEGTGVELSLEGGCLVVRVLPDSGTDLDQLLAGVNEENLHAEIESGDAVGDEHW
jgi:antitoxin MazE